jgi:N-methylhydantoinase A
VNCIRIGVDTGGTFTDFIAVADQQLISFKIPSTPQAPACAILEGLRRILNGLPAADSCFVDIVHGTTVATNALLERKGAKTALITTEGFEDVLEIGRQARPDLYNFAVTRPDPLVAQKLRFGLRERVAANGSIIEPLDAVQLKALARKLRMSQVESVAISLLFSFANPSHEQQIAVALAAINIPLSLSHRILPEYREYERTSTVVVNAYLAPRVSQYLRGLTKELAHLMPDAASRLQAGRERPLKNNRQYKTELPNHSYALRVMQSSGGSISAETAASEPVRTILSGPAGGVVAAAKIAALAGEPNVITFDMGGTSTDVALCQGEAATTNESAITGLPIAVPVIDIHTVGAGGGSIAYLDGGGALRVGPESAGADPGPACYGKGTRPTVTDANLVLGRFAPEGLLGGAMRLDYQRACAVMDDLARQMSIISRQRISPESAASGIIQVVNANMERALRLVSVERGHDPRRFALLSFGGAGGLHATALADALRIPRVISPIHPGAFSALGVLLSDVIRESSRTVMLTVSGNEKNIAGRVRRSFAELDKKIIRELRAEGFASTHIELKRTLAMRYVGQSFDLHVPLLADFARVLAEFHQLHQQRYGHSNSGQVVEIVSLRVRGLGRTEKPELKKYRIRSYKPKADQYSAMWLAQRKMNVAVYDRRQLRPGAIISAPALITEYGSTTLVEIGWELKIDVWGNLLIGRVSAES